MYFKSKLGISPFLCSFEFFEFLNFHLSSAFKEVQNVEFEFDRTWGKTHQVFEF